MKKCLVIFSLLLCSLFPVSSYAINYTVDFSFSGFNGKTFTDSFIDLPPEDAPQDLIAGHISFSAEDLLSFYNFTDVDLNVAGAEFATADLLYSVEISNRVIIGAAESANDIVWGQYTDFWIQFRQDNLAFISFAYTIEENYSIWMKYALDQDDVFMIRESAATPVPEPSTLLLLGGGLAGLVLVVSRKGKE